METVEKGVTKEPIPQEIIAEAAELIRGAEVLPDGLTGLASKIWQACKADRPLRVKLGIDPTSTDLHLGHAVVFRKLRRFQDFGHQIIVIIGGFTAQIGDPTGRNSTRPPLTAEQVMVNAKTYLDQMSVIIDLEKAELTNNADWLAKMDLSALLKLAGSVTLNQLLAKEAFGDRLEKQLPLGFHELFYPLLQGYDSIAIRSDVELGGTDQRFNILQGRELQPIYGQEPQLALLLPLLEGTDGVQKMSKSFNNYIGLKDEPNDMFGKSMRIPDELLFKYFDLATTLTGQEVDAIKAALAAGGNPMQAKLQLATQIVKQYWGDEVSCKALAEWQRVHSERQAPAEMPSYVVAEPTAVFRLILNSKLALSGGEAKRLVQEGGVRLNGEVVSDPNQIIQVDEASGIVLQVGRRKFIRLQK